MSEQKKSRGKPPGSLKPNAKRKIQKIRWNEEEFDAVQAAAEEAGKDVCSFVREAALARCRKN